MAKRNGAMGMLLVVSALLLAVESPVQNIEGRWQTGRGAFFVIQQSGTKFSGAIEGRPGERTYKIVDGELRGKEVSFFVLHDAKDDSEVVENGGKPFRNTAAGVVEGDEMTIAGAREGTGQRAYKLTLKRVKE